MNLWTKSCGVTIQMKCLRRNIHIVLFIQYVHVHVVLPFECVDKILWCAPFKSNVFGRTFTWYYLVVSSNFRICGQNAIVLPCLWQNFCIVLFINLDFRRRYLEFFFGHFFILAIIKREWVNLSVILEFIVSHIFQDIDMWNYGNYHFTHSLCSSSSLTSPKFLENDKKVMYYNLWNTEI